MPFFEHDRVRFHFRDEGSGLPFVFQHGLCNDVSQPFDLFAPPPGVRLLSLDCRGHGQTQSPEVLGPVSIERFADDLRALMEQLEIDTAIVGGISMGAAIATNLALRVPRLVVALVISRPAWLDAKFPDNLRSLAIVAQLMRQHGFARGRQAFEDSAHYCELCRESAACAESILRLFDSSRPTDVVQLLEKLPASRPFSELSKLSSINVPTLVLANRLDPIHPFQYGQTLASHIAQADFREITPRTTSIELHQAEAREAIRNFLERPERFFV